MVAAVSTPKARQPTAQKRPNGREQLRRDRITFALVILLVAGLTGLSNWLAAVSPSAGYNAFNYCIY